MKEWSWNPSEKEYCIFENAGNCIKLEIYDMIVDQSEDSKYKN